MFLATGLENRNRVHSSDLTQFKHSFFFLQTCEQSNMMGSEQYGGPTFEFKFLSINQSFI